MNFDRQINKILGKKVHSVSLSKGKTKKDWDGDGIPNKKDCQPRNIMKQDRMKKNTRFNLGDRVRVKLKGVNRGKIKHIHNKKDGYHTHKNWLFPEGIGRIIRITRTAPIQYIVELEEPFYNTHGYMIKTVSGFEDELTKVYPQYDKMF